MAQDAAQHWTRYVEPVMTRHGDTKVGFNRMPQLCVASGLVVYEETGSQESPEYQARLEERQYRAHLGAQSDSQFRSMR